MTGRFQRFDYGKSENLEMYGTDKPPEYNLSNIRIKLQVIYGTNDYVARPEACFDHISAKKNQKKFKIIFCSSFLQNVPLWVAKMKNAVITLKKTDFNHINYITGRSVRPLQPMILKAITKNS